MALVNFVRPAMFLGDSIDVDIWDGSQYVGSLAAGRMIQHEVAPGTHVFLGNAENWSHASGELQAGRQYVIKANVFPGVLSGRAFLGVAKPEDKRIPEWLGNLKPTAATDKDRLELAGKKQADIQQAMADFDSGKATLTRIRPEDGIERVPALEPESRNAQQGRARSQR
jgi:hypothetical protein